MSNPTSTDLAQLGRRLQTVARWLRVAPDARDGAEGFASTIREALAELEKHVAVHRARDLAQAMTNVRAEGEAPLRLHLGAEAPGIPSWLNCGLDGCDVRLDVIERLPFGDGVASHVYASHLLEHLMYPGQAAAFLRECLRVLAPNGRLRLVVPDLGKFLRAVASDDQEFLSHRSRAWRLEGRTATPLSTLLKYAGASCDPSSAAHKFGYDFATLEQLLRDAGFRQVRECSFMQSPDPVLRIDAHSRVNGRAGPRGHYSLFVEATR